MKLHSLIVLILFLFFVDDGYSQDRWTYVCGIDSDNKGSVYYDTETLVKSNNYVIAWVKYQYLTPTYDEDSHKYIQMALQKYQFDCNRVTMQMLSWIDYYPDGSSNSKSIPNSKVIDIYPESIGERLFNALCK